MRTDLIATRESLLPARASAAQRAGAASIAAAQSPACEQAFLATCFDAGPREARGPGRRGPAAGRVGRFGQGPVRRRRPGHRRRLASCWPMRPPRSADSPAVARLRAAGGALLGRTNMTEFAFSGVGINPHHGTPANPARSGRAAHSRRLVLRRRGLGGHRRGLHRPGLRHRRLDPHPGRAVRHRRLQEHGAAGADATARCRCRPRWTRSAR